MKVFYTLLLAALAGSVTASPVANGGSYKDVQGIQRHLIQHLSVPLTFHQVIIMIIMIINAPG